MDAKKLFRNAMIELMEEYSFDEITVQKLLEKTTLSRATFYRHFKDKYDLLNWHYQAYVISLYENKNYPTYDMYLKEIYTILFENIAYFKKALAINKANSFYDFLYEFSYDYLKNAYSQYYNCSEIDSKTKITIGYIAIGQAYTAKMWIMHGCKESIDDISRWAYELVPEEYQEALNYCCSRLCEEKSVDTDLL